MDEEPQAQFEHFSCIFRVLTCSIFLLFVFFSVVFSKFQCFEVFLALLARALLSPELTRQAGSSEDNRATPERSKLKNEVEWIRMVCRMVCRAMLIMLATCDHGDERWLCGGYAVATGNLTSDFGGASALVASEPVSPVVRGTHG